MMKQSKLDLLLAGMTAIQLVILLSPFIVPGLAAESRLWLLAVLGVYLTGVNYQCTAHNFIHHPFFTSRTLNSVFSIVNTLVLGLPQSVYRIHHLNHHRYNNDPRFDDSSTLRHGTHGEDENIVLYSTLGVVRADVLALYRKARQRSGLVAVELAALTAFVATLAVLNWRLTLAYVVPIYVAGHMFALWENYCEHHLADPHDRLRDSVSCYGRLYNVLWFNNGYHQEHHLQPQVHWTRVPEVTARLPQDRVTVNYCHLAISFRKRDRSTALRPKPSE